LTKKLNIIFLIFFFLFCINTFAYANFKEKLITKYKTIDTLQFDFTQKIGENVEFGNCYIKYPLLMRCEYSKKEKTIVTNGKILAVVKKKYKKIYYYPLKKTPLFFILNKENIINVVKNYEPIYSDSNIIEYELSDIDFNILNIFFDKKSLELLGWKTFDAYSNNVDFSIKNIKTNVLIENEIFKIPMEADF
jgi:outer membrane lipoprotein-sorting protein